MNEWILTKSKNTETDKLTQKNNESNQWTNEHDKINEQKENKHINYSNEWIHMNKQTNK